MRENAITRRGKLAFSALVAGLLLFFGLSVAMSQQAFADDLTAGSIQTQDVTGTYTFGTTKTGTVEYGGGVNTYSFSVNSDMDVNVSVSCTKIGESNWFGMTSPAMYMEISSSTGKTYYDGKVLYGAGESTSESNIFLPKGTYKAELRTFSNCWVDMSFKFSVTKVKHTVSLDKKSVNLKPDDTTEVSYVVSGSSEYAANNLKIAKNSNSKVASAVLEAGTGSGGNGVIKLTPKKLGKTVITLKTTDGASASVTAFVKKQNVFVAVGNKTKLAKPIGVKSPTFTSKKKSVATVGKKNGKVTAKKQGRATIVAKKGSTKYNYNVVVTNYTKLAREMYNYLEEYVPDPDALKINYAYKGLDQKIVTGQKIPVVYLDYSFTNENGGKSRNKIIGWYDDALDMQFKLVSTSSEVMKKKSMKKSSVV